jgi:hypothetical protein
MRRARYGLAAAALALAGQPALAEYGPTRWGMTPDEVIAAVGGDARKVKDDKGKRILDHKLFVMSKREDGGMTYEVSYFFGKDGKGLSMVNLVPPTSDANCAATRAAFTQRLGAGAERSKTVIEGLVQSSITWPTGPGEEVVEFLEIRLFGSARHCQVLYQQRDGTKN